MHPKTLHVPIQPTLKFKNTYVYLEIQRGIYGIPQAGISDNKKLRYIMAQEG